MRPRNIITKKTMAYMGKSSTKGENIDAVKSALTTLKKSIKQMQFAFDDFYVTYKHIADTPEDFINQVGGRDNADALNYIVNHPDNFNTLGDPYNGINDFIDRLLKNLP